MTDKQVNQASRALLQEFADACGYQFFNGTGLNLVNAFSYHDDPITLISGLDPQIIASEVGIHVNEAVTIKEMANNYVKAVAANRLHPMLSVPRFEP